MTYLSIFLNLHFIICMVDFRLQTNKKDKNMELMRKETQRKINIHEYKQKEKFILHR